MAHFYQKRFTGARVPFTVRPFGSVEFELDGGLHGSTLLGGGASLI